MGNAYHDALLLLRSNLKRITTRYIFPGIKINSRTGQKMDHRATVNDLGLRSLMGIVMG